MKATAFPFVGNQPFLEVEEPQRDPRHDRRVDAHPRAPLTAVREIQTKASRSLLVYVLQAPTVGELGEIWTIHECARAVSQPVLNADRVESADRRGRSLVPPHETPGTKLAFSGAQRADA